MYRKKITASINQQALRQILEQAAAEGARNALKAQESAANLDNRIADTTRIPPSTKGEDGMPRQRFHVPLPNGEKVWVTGNTIDEAFLNYFARAEKPSHDAEPASSMTLRDFIDQTFRPQFIKGLAPTTVANYEIFMKSYLLPFMGDRQMRDIRMGDVQEFFNWLAEGSKHGMRKDINEATIKRIRGFAGRVFDIAREYKLVSENPFKSRLLRINAESAGHHVPMTDDEIDRAKRELTKLANPATRMLFAIPIYTGMRREEVLALRWENVNLLEGLCEVCATVTYPDNSKPVIRKQTKSANSERTVILPKALVSIMRPYQQDSGYVIGGDKPLCYSTFTRWVRKGREILGITEYSMHDFRTTFGTQLKEDGMTSAQVADLMGHADTRMVETVYARRRQEGILKRRGDIERLNAAYIAN